MQTPQIQSFLKPDCHPESKFAALRAAPIEICKAGARRQDTVQIECRDNPCELALTDATREIARLRSLLLVAARCCEQKHDAIELPCAPAPQESAQARRPYAPPALGEPTAQRDVLPPHQPEALRMMQQVTNLGTLVDVLL